MKKRTILLLGIVSVVLTFVIADVLSIYSFGSIPTLLTSLYLISIFCIINYVLNTICYIGRKIIMNEKINLKKIGGLVCLGFALIIIFFFLITINVDYLHQYMYSSPFYLTVIVRCVEFLIPALVFIIISIVLFRKK